MTVYRNDRDALSSEVRDLRHQLERAQQENAAMRGALLAPQRVALTGKQIYASGGALLEPGHRAALSHHQLERFPVWAVAVLHLLTFGLFSLFHFGRVHDQLPRAADDDPSAVKAIGLMFVPYFNLYWVFMHSLRLADRINLQFALRGQGPGVSRELVLASCIVGVIPYINFLIGGPIMWLITAISMQRAINHLVEQGPGLAAPLPGPAGWQPPPPGGWPLQAPPPAAPWPRHGG